MIELFGLRLRELREEAKLTQQQLADGCGVSLSTISSWEQCRREPTFMMAALMAFHLGVSTEAFLEPKGTKSRPAKRGRPKKQRNQG